MENHIRKYIVRITFFFLPPAEWKSNYLPFHWHCILAHTMLQQLQNLASDDILHGYQTYPVVESFPMLERMSFAESRVEDCLELNFRYVDYQTLVQ